MLAKLFIESFLPHEINTGTSILKTKICLTAFALFHFQNWKNKKANVNICIFENPVFFIHFDIPHDKTNINYGIDKLSYTGKKKKLMEAR